MCIAYYFVQQTICSKNHQCNCVPQYITTSLVQVLDVMYRSKNMSISYLFTNESVCRDTLAEPRHARKCLHSKGGPKLYCVTVLRHNQSTHIFHVERKFLQTQSLLAVEDTVMLCTMSNFPYFSQIHVIQKLFQKEKLIRD